MRNLHNSKKKTFYYFYPIKNTDTVSLLKYSFINITSLIFLIFLIFITYKFINDLKFDIGLVSFVISFIISYLISSFVLNDYKYSENKIISYMQNLFFFNLIIFAIFFIASYLYLLSNLILLF